MAKKNNFDKKFYCMDIDIDSIWIAYFTVDENNLCNTHLIKQIKISSVISDNKINISNLNTAIGKVIDAVQKYTSEKIESIFLTSNILTVNSYIRKVQIKIPGNKLITNFHIKESFDELKKTFTSSLPANETVMQIIPIRYDLEDRRLDNPIGFKSSELMTTYNIITANTAVLSTIKNIFEKYYQIKVADIISHHQSMMFVLSTVDEKKSPTIIIDVKNGITNISLVYRNKLVKCISNDNHYEIDFDISDYNLYNTMQTIKSSIPEIIFKPTQSLIIYGNIDSNISTLNLMMKVFERPSKIITSNSENISAINGLIYYATEQIINEKNYWGISNEKLSILGVLKNIIDENL